MLYLKSLVLDKFKSFKHAELLFNNGFTCVVGPNGSGKSNICDALFFGLGETSLRRMRAKKLTDLIMLGQKKRAGELPKAYIKAEFSGDEDITILHAVRADGKALFKVNGKKTTRQEVTEVLKKHNIHIDETSTIAQGEIQAISDMSPRERRELIDIAAGIQEFEAKKTEAMRELEKVSTKVNEANIMLHERGAFLGELEKEKEAAEKYTTLAARQRILNYSILTSRKGQAQQSLDSYTKEMALMDAKANEIQAGTDEQTRKIEQFSADRQIIMKEIAEGSKNAGETNKKLEEINKELATIAVEVDNFAREMDEKSKFSKGASEEIRKAKETVETDAKKIEEKKKALAEITAQLGESKASTELGQEEVEKRLKVASDEIGSYEAKINSLQANIGTLNTEITLGRSNKENADKAQTKAEKARIEKKRTLDDIAKKASKLTSESKLKQTEVTAAEDRLGQIEHEISDIDERHIQLMEQRSMVRENASVGKIKDAFTDKDGFYGKAGELCTYSLDDAIAVETAAGARFDYLVVDTISTANKMIEFLKKNDLGRLTFMPLKELRAEDVDYSDSMQPAINLIKFDAKFKKVFNYILGNTYVIKGTEDAKKHGIGKHRYVTPAGELVEQSGILSGGSTKKRMSVSVIDGQIKLLAKQKTELRAEHETLSAKTKQLRKEQAAIEVEFDTLRKDGERLEGELKEIAAEAETSASYVEELDAKIRDTEKRMLMLDKEKLESMERLTAAKEQQARLITESVEAGRKIAKLGKAEREKIKKLTDGATALQVEIATLMTERSMLVSKITDDETAVTAAKKEVAAAKKTTAEKKLRGEILEKAKEEIEKEVNSSSASTKKAFDKQAAIDEEIRKLSIERGKLAAQLDSLNRQLGDLKVKRGQAEVRLTDLTIELAAYKDQKIDAANEKLEEMERELVIIGSKIGELGNVNLKAPELYEQRKKDVDEVASKVATLEAERQAVINMIEEIDSKKFETFVATFTAISRNFSKLYAYFSPLPAALELDDVKNPLDGGLEIKIKNGNNYKRVDSMSGGEKAQLLLSLIFAIHMCKPSSLYIFDEVDAALDKENSKKLSLLIKDMAKDAQFVVVSHNDSLIVNSGTAIGVVKADGDSKAVGIEISNYIVKK